MFPFISYQYGSFANTISLQLPKNKQDLTYNLVLGQIHKYFHMKLTKIIHHNFFPEIQLKKKNLINFFGGSFFDEVDSCFNLVAKLCKWWWACFCLLIYKIVKNGKFSQAIKDKMVIIFTV